MLNHGGEVSLLQALEIKIWDDYALENIINLASPVTNVISAEKVNVRTHLRKVITKRIHYSITGACLH